MWNCPSRARRTAASPVAHDLHTVALERHVFFQSERDAGS